MGSAPLTNLNNQVLPNPGVLPYVQQQNFGQMIGFVSDQNPDLDFSTIQVILNNIVRKIYDRRTWYGLFVYGQISTQQMVIGGTVNVTNGSTAIPGTGTAWDASLIGRCFRIGYNTPLYVIQQVDAANQIITIQIPWAGSSMTGSGYIISQNYYTIGPNIRYLHTAKNLLMAWRMQLGYNQQTLDSVDVWRINTFMPACLAQMPPDQNGGYQVELWPTPSIQQGIPFIAVVQPPNLVDDGDSVPAYIRTDIITKFAIAEARVYRGPKVNKYYDFAESQRMRNEAEAELVQLALADENLYRQNLQWELESMRMAPTPWELTETYGINHGVTAPVDSGGWW